MSTTRIERFGDVRTGCTATLIIAQFANGLYQLGRYIPCGYDIPLDSWGPYFHREEADKQFDKAAEHLVQMGYPRRQASPAEGASVATPVDEGLGWRLKYNDEKSVPMVRSSTEDAYEILGYGWAATCTSHAMYVAEKEKGKVVGFMLKDNPAPRLAGICDGHDFALIDGRWIIDTWAAFWEEILPVAVIDIKDPNNAELVRAFFGDPAKWQVVRDFTGEPVGKQVNLAEMSH